MRASSGPSSGNLDAIERFVRPLAESWDGDAPKLAALAATEPGLGSDFIMGHPQGRAQTRVETKGEGYVINGRKIFISNGSLASLVTVFASHDPRSPLRDNVSCFAVPTDTPGFSVGQNFDKMGQRACPASELLFDDVFVPADHLIGEERAGWQLNRTIMSVTRTPVATIALGIARAAYEKALDYACERVQGGQSIVRRKTPRSGGKPTSTIGARAACPCSRSAFALSCNRSSTAWSCGPTSGSIGCRPGASE